MARKKADAVEVLADELDDFIGEVGPVQAEPVLVANPAANPEDVAPWVDPLPSQEVMQGVFGPAAALELSQAKLAIGILQKQAEATAKWEDTLREHYEEQARQFDNIREAFVGLNRRCLEMAEDNAFLKSGRPLDIPEELIEALRRPLPPEALQPHGSNPDLSSIKGIFITERLNDVFGIAGWYTETEVLESAGEMIVVKTTLTIEKYGISKWAFGGNAMRDRGDAYKGAVTDSMSKCACQMYIGQDVFKGNGPTSDKNKKGIPAQSVADALTTLPAGRKDPAPRSGPAALPAASSEPVKIKCEEDGCNRFVIEVTRNGQVYTPDQIVSSSQRKYKVMRDGKEVGLNLCGACQTARGAAERAAAANDGQSGSGGAAPAVPAVSPASYMNGTPAPIR